MKDGDLVIRFQNGEEQAFDELVKRHYSTTHNLLVRLSGNSMDADDLCQETFIRVYRSLRKFKAQSQFSSSPADCRDDDPGAVSWDFQVGAGLSTNN